MSNASDFIIENGVLTKYVGPGGDVVIPDGVVEIGASAFSLCTKITSVTICDGMEHIGEYAFEKCRKLESICLPNTVKTIGKGAFYYCDALIALELPENVQITKVSDIVSNCFQLARLILPQSLPFEKEYETATFGLFGCNAIGLLVYPSIKLEDVSPKLQGAAVTGFTYYFERFTDPAVRESYFSQLMKKKAVFLEMILRYNDASLLQMLAERGKITKKNVDEEYLKPALQANAVQCTQFLLNWKNTHVKSEKDITTSMGKQLDASPKDPYNAADMKKIWASEKAEDETLILTSYKAKEQEIETPVRIGKNKTSKLGNYTFSVYASDFIIENGVLTKYVGPGGDVVIPEGVSSVGKKAFFKCNELLHITIPEGVAIIEASAFEECRSLVTTTLPETLTGIGTSAFKRCSALVSVSIPNPECSIGDSAFRACRSLKDIVLPKGLKKIGKATFLGCDALGELTIPETVKTISDYAFADTDDSGQILPRQCACPLLTILGVPKMSDLVFGSSIKRSEQNAPPIWFANMPLADVPKPYKKAAAEGFMITWHKKPELVENQKDTYIKHLKSQRKKYYDRLIKEEKLLYLFLRESILSKEDITALIDLGSAGISTEIKAMLLEYSK